MSPISWGSSEPTPDKKAHFEPVRNEGCPYCTYVAGAQRRTKAQKLVQEHVRRKHKKEYGVGTVETESYRMVKCPGMSPVCEMLDADEENFNKKVEEEGPKVCLICQSKEHVSPAVRFTMGTSWSASGEELIFTFAVCEEHRGMWIWYPKNQFTAVEGMYRLDKQMPEDEPEEWDEEEEFDKLSPGAQEKVRNALKPVEVEDD